MHYFYILRCVDNSLYCGITKDLKRRIDEHNFDYKKAAKYTRSRRPVFLVYSEKFSTIQETLKREYEVKQWSKERKEELVKSVTDKTKI